MGSVDKRCQAVRGGVKRGEVGSEGGCEKSGGKGVAAVTGLEV